VPPVGVVGQPIRPEVMNSLLGSSKGSVAIQKPVKVQAQKGSQTIKPVEKTATKVDMATWSIPRLEKAYQKAYDDGDTPKMAQIQAILNNK
jgi:hypothetical protein